MKLEEAIKKFKLSPPTSDVITNIMVWHKVEGEIRPEVIEWKRAFDYYNERNHPKKGMYCRPCYGLVYNYLKQENLLEDTYIIGADKYSSDNSDKVNNIGSINIYKKIKPTLWQRIKNIWSQL